VRIIRMNVTVRMVDSFGPQLQGRSLGRKHFARLCELLSDAPPGEIVLLDFSGVELVTGSWINAVLVPFLRWAGEDGNDLYPVVCNTRKEWLEELQLVAEFSQRCYLVASGKLPPHAATIAGPLDPAQRKTLEAVLASKEVTGAELERQKPDEKIGATAWNNRLRELHDMRLLRREKRGREQVYSPVVEEIAFNG
jgi:hypothetical protein